MKLLLDTHLVLWAAYSQARLSSEAVALIGDEANELWFSSMAVAEIAIKFARGRPDFAIEPRITRRLLIENGYRELAVNGLHAIGLAELPAIHRDPFDRLMIAQALTEGMTLLTSDATVVAYGACVRRV
jgi:PIN domain nuclease of toxin-antitoxin system